MQKELNTLKANDTWQIIDYQKDDNKFVKPLKTRWVYKIKDYNDYIEFKSRFVAKGFEQILGLNYIDSFASVIKQMAWKLIFALAVINNWSIYKIDMISAFTQGNADAKILLKFPEGVINDNNQVLLLNKALYGLKQSARIWYFTLYNVLVQELGFIMLKTENCIFINKTLNIILCVYVDDIAIIGPNDNIIKSFINNIEKYFEIKNLGLLKDYLGINIDYDKGHYMNLSQEKYIDKLLIKYNLEDSNPIYTPMDPKIKFELNNNKEYATKEQIKWFQTLIGSLLYLMMATRIDITYAVIKLSRYATNPSEIHIIALKRILKYLKTTKHYVLSFNLNNDLSNYLIGYCDADYAGDINTAKSTSGYIFFYANGLISWKSKLQIIIAQSTTEAEYMAINALAKEAIYIKSILDELGFYKQKKLPIYTDNNGALLLAKNPIYYERTKHISVKYHYIRYLIDNNIIDLNYVNTLSQKADDLTKALDKVKFKVFLQHLNFID